MNSALRSLELSPSFQLLQESGSSMSNMIYTLDDSIVPLAKQKYELNLPTSCNFGSNVSLDLLRVGILSGITLKLHMNGFNASSVGAVGGGYNAIKQISLCSHNKKIITLDKSSIQWRLSKLDERIRDQVYSSAQYFGVVPNQIGVDETNDSEYGKRVSTGTTFSATEDSVANTSTQYLYIPFCIFEDGLRTMASFNMEYIENLTLNIEFDVASEMVDTGGSPSLKASQCKVIVHYFDMTNDDKRKFEEMNYKVKNEDGDGAVDGNLSMVLKDYYVEPAVPSLKVQHNATAKLATSNVAGKVGVFQQNLTCRNVITSIYIRVQNADSQKGLEGIDSIESVELQLDGKSYVKFDREELMLRSAVNMGVSVPDQGVAVSRNASDDNYLELKFDMNKSNAFSGAISARNTGSPKLIVRCLANNTSASGDNGYKLHVVCEHISMITIQEIDGRIQKSQNL